MPKHPLDWIGLLLFLFGGIGGAFLLYLRTSYRGGWPRGRDDFIVAVVALLSWAAIRLFDHYGIQAPKHAFETRFH